MIAVFVLLLVYGCIILASLSAARSAPYIYRTDGIDTSGVSYEALVYDTWYLVPECLDCCTGGTCYLVHTGSSSSSGCW